MQTSARLLLSAAFLALGCRSFDGFAVRDRVKIIRDIPYVAGSTDPKQALDLFLPIGKENAPVVVFIHGGYWTNQDRSYYWPFTGLYRNVGFALAQKGYAVAVISYRLAPGTPIEGQLDDAKAAVQWVAANARTHGVDPNRLVIMGHSAGGQIASMLCLDKSLLKETLPSVRACIAMSPVLDIRHMEQNHDAQFNDSKTYAAFGKTPAYERYSPKVFLSASRDHVPYLLLTGTKDYEYLRDQAKTAADNAKDDAKFSHQSIEGYDHSEMVLKINTSEDLITPVVAQYLSSISL